VELAALSPLTLVASLPETYKELASCHLRR